MCLIFIIRGATAPDWSPYENPFPILFKRFNYNVRKFGAIRFHLIRASLALLEVQVLRLLHNNKNQITKSTISIIFPVSFFIHRRDIVCQATGVDKLLCCFL
jgi:hypothetical protein